MRLTRHRRDLTERLATRLDDLRGDLTDQLYVDLAAVATERRAVIVAARYVELRACVAR